MKIKFLAIMAVVVGGLLAACGDSATSTPAAPPPNAVAYSAIDYAFAGPATLPSGLTEITLTNQGTELHHQQIIKLPEGMTTGDFFALLEQLPPDAPTPPGIELTGGVAFVDPGVSGKATLDLAVGNYMMLCFVPNAEGIPHAALGMALPITVTQSTEPAAAEPEATVSMSMLEFAFDLSAPITGGPQVIEATNVGAQEHEFIVVQLQTGATIEEFLEAVESPTGPPPGQFLGGLQAVSPGGRGFITLDLAPGRYTLVCGIPDEATGAPHFALGMLHQFTIQ